MTMMSENKNVEHGTGHTLSWVIEGDDEDMEIVEWHFEHPKDCPVVVEEAHDADSKLAWQNSYYECAVQFVCEELDDFEDYMYSQGLGEHEVKFEYTYRYHPPCYPDYEPDWDFDWKPE